MGNTSPIDLSKILTEVGINNAARFLGKIESLGPCSSVKDCIGKYMIDDAEEKGLIYRARTVLVEQN